MFCKFIIIRFWRAHSKTLENIENVEFYINDALLAKHNSVSSRLNVIKTINMDRFTPPDAMQLMKTGRSESKN